MICVNQYVQSHHFRSSVTCERTVETLANEVVADRHQRNDEETERGEGNVSREGEGQTVCGGGSRHLEGVWGTVTDSHCDRVFARWDGLADRIPVGHTWLIKTRTDNIIVLEKKKVRKIHMAGAKPL